MDNEKIGKYLLQKRKELNKTQKDIADILGITYQAVSRWENGDSIPDIETLGLLADLYDVSIDEIVQREYTIKTDVEEDVNITWFLTVVCLILFTIGYLGFWLINKIWIPEVALAVYIFVTLSAFIVIAFGIFTRKYENELERKDLYAFGTLLIPFAGFTTLVIISLLG